MPDDDALTLQDVRPEHMRTLEMLERALAEIREIRQIVADLKAAGEWVPASDLTAAVRILCRHYDPTEVAIAAARLRDA